MTREEIKQQFPEATEEQVSAILNAHHAELKPFKEKAELYDAAEQEKLSAEEKLNKLLAEAESAKAENFRMLNRTKAMAKFAAAGISEEHYSSLLDGIVSDDEEKTLAFADNIIKAINGASENAKAAAKQELMAVPPPAGKAAEGTADDLRKALSQAEKSCNFVDMIKANDAAFKQNASGTQI
jgi:hypothetical protein